MTGTPSQAAPLAVGEIHTALLRSSSALSLAACKRLVARAGGEPVLWHERPIMHVASPRVLTGVDCRPATIKGTKARVVGTVDGRLSVTGGHVIQGAVSTRIVPGARGGGRRMGWSHYLARPGMVELIGGAAQEDLLAGFLQLEPTSEVLDLGSVCARLINDTQDTPSLDGRVPFRAVRTRLRWSALHASVNAPSTAFRIDQHGLRTLTVRSDLDPTVVADFAADIALHDWLLTALLGIIDRSRIGMDERSTVIARLRPAVEHLLHLWMPVARVRDVGVGLWAGFERTPGLTRQWQAAVDRIRDQLAMGAITALNGRFEEALP